MGEVVQVKLTLSGLQDPGDITMLPLEHLVGATVPEELDQNRVLGGDEVDRRTGWVELDRLAPLELKPDYS